MWCRFDDKEHVSSVNNVKSSVQKAIRNKILEQFPHLESYLEQILPKKDPMRIAKWWESDLGIGGTFAVFLACLVTKYLKIVITPSIPFWQLKIG